MADEATRIGYAMLPVSLSFDGITKGIASKLGAPLKAAATKAGTDAGSAIANGIEQAQSKVDAATQKMAASHKKVEDAAGKVRVAEAQMQALVDKGVTDAGRLAAAEEKVAAARRNHVAAQNTHTNATGALTRAQENLTRAQKQSNDAQNDGVRASRNLGGSLTDIGRNAGGAITSLKNLAIATAGIGTAMDLVKTSMDMQGSLAKMNASLGASGKVAEDYGRDAANLYKRGFGDSMDDVTAAVEAVASSMPVIGFEGEVSLDKAAERAMNLSKVFGVDVAEAIQSTEQLITNGLAKDSTQAMDLLTTAMQRVPASMRGELPEILGEYGKHFQTFGMTGEAAMGLIVEMAPQGKIALDKTGDAIKELSIRATDGSKSTTAAFDAIKVDGDKMARSIAQGGPGAQAAMQEIAKGLLTIQDPAARAQQAIALFGTPLEDLGVDQIPKFLSSLSAAGDTMTGFEGATDRMGDTLNNTAQAKLTSLGRTIQTGLVQSLGGAIGFLQNVFNSDAIQSFVGRVTTLFQTGWPVVVDIAKSVGGALLDIGQVAGPVLLGALDGLAAAIGGFIETGSGILNFFRENKELAAALAVVLAVTLGPTIAAMGTTAALSATGFILANTQILAMTVASKAAAFASKAWAATQWILNAALSANPIGLIIIAITALVAGIIYAWKNSETFRDIVTGAWNMVKDAVAAVVDWFVNTAWPFLQRVWEGIKDGWNSLVGSAEAVWNGIKDKFSAVVDFIAGLPAKIADKARGMWDGITSAFKSMVNGLIDMWNGFASKLSFTMPDIPGVPRRGERIQPIPSIGWRMADGGVLPEQAMIAAGRGRGLIQWAEGETGGEAFIPLGLRKRARSEMILSDVARRFGKTLIDGNNPLRSFANGGISYGLPRGTNISYGQSDKFPEWVRALEQQFGVKASTYAGHQEKDGLNKGIDWSGPVDAMQKFAEYARTVPGIEQVIWQNPNTGQKIGVADGKPVGPGTDQPGYYRDDWAGHADHVHTRQSWAFGPGAGQTDPAAAATQVVDTPQVSSSAPATAEAAPVSASTGSDSKGMTLGEWIGRAIFGDWKPGGAQTSTGAAVASSSGVPAATSTAASVAATTPAVSAPASVPAAVKSKLGSLTSTSSKDDIAAAIYLEGRRRGLTDAEAKAAVAMHMQESGLDPNADGGDQGIGGALGLAQQGNSYGARADRLNPNKAITAFYDRLGETQGDIWNRIVAVQQHGGGAYQGTAGDQKYMGEIKSQASAATKLIDALNLNSEVTTTATEAAKPDAATPTTPAASTTVPTQASTTGSDTEPKGLDTSPLKELTDILGGGFMETLGLDGSLFPDIANLGIVKMAKAVMGIKFTPPPWMEGKEAPPPWLAGAGAPFAPASAAAAAPVSASPSQTPGGGLDLTGVPAPSVAGPGAQIPIDASININNPQGNNDDLIKKLRRVQPEQRTRLAGAVPVGR